MSPKSGEIWIADLGFAAKTRPVVVVSRDDNDPPRALTIYVPITHAFRGSPYEVPLSGYPFLGEGSFANVQGIGSVPLIRLQRKVGRLSEHTISEIRTAIRYALDL